MGLFPFLGWVCSRFACALFGHGAFHRGKQDGIKGKFCGLCDTFIEDDD